MIEARADDKYVTYAGSKIDRSSLLTKAVRNPADHN
jgi:hypothetical protein